MLPEKLPNQDKLTNSIQTLPYKQVFKEEETDPYNLYPPTRLITPMIPVVVRQDDPQGPRYQEARGYSFLVNSMKFPFMARMDDGRLVLSAAAALHPGLFEDPIGYVDDPIWTTSEDDGISWAEPARAEVLGLPIPLRGQRLALHGGGWLRLSDDAGRTWGEPEPIPKVHGRYDSHLRGSVLVEGDTISSMSYIELSGDDSWLQGAVGTSQTVLRRYHLDTHTWDEPLWLPKEWPTSEASLTRAANGDLVAALRTAMPGVAIHSDHWRGITTSRSSDEGRTWSDLQYHFLYGHHHMELLTFDDGRILMTYMARIGELEGTTYHGVEAVLSDDHGATWDWERRFIIFRWPSGTMGGLSSVRLSDGRILTIFQHDHSYSWANREFGSAWDAGKWTGTMNFSGNMSVVIWSPD